MKFTCTKDLFRIMHGRKQLLIQKTLRSHHFMEKRKTWKYLGGLLSIIFYEADLENRTKQWINDIIIFNNEHIIQRYNIPQSNIPK